MYTNGLLYVCVGRVGIQMTNLKDEKIKTVVKCSLLDCTYITVFNEKFIILVILQKPLTVLTCMVIKSGHFQMSPS